MDFSDWVMVIAGAVTVFFLGAWLLDEYAPTTPTGTQTTYQQPVPTLSPEQRQRNQDRVDDAIIDHIEKRGETDRIWVEPTCKRGEYCS